jgi:hypothetical protein
VAELTKSTLTFNPAEEEEFKKLVTITVGKLIDEHFNGRVRDIAEMHAQLERHVEKLTETITLAGTTEVARVLSATTTNREG